MLSAIAHLLNSWVFADKNKAGLSRFFSLCACLYGDYPLCNNKDNCNLNRMVNLCIASLCSWQAVS